MNSIFQHLYVSILVLSVFVVCIEKGECRKIDADIFEVVEKASKKYKIPEELILSYAIVESNLSRYAVCFKGQSKHFSTAQKAKEYLQAQKYDWKGNFDLGIMQINSRWGAKFDYKIENYFDLEQNIDVGSWIIKTNLETSGWTWKAIALYNTTKLQSDWALEYAGKVIATYKHLTQLRDLR